jgi:hypothetical protein
MHSGGGIADTLSKMRNLAEATMSHHQDQVTGSGPFHASNERYSYEIVPTKMFVKNQHKRIHQEEREEAGIYNPSELWYHTESRTNAS